MKYKAVLTHVIRPGKYNEVIEWLKKGGAPEKGPTQYITVYGNVNQIVIELESDTIPEMVYAEATHNEELLPLIVPGSTELRLLKRCFPD